MAELRESDERSLWHATDQRIVPYEQPEAFVDVSEADYIEGEYTVLPPREGEGTGDLPNREALNANFDLDGAAYEEHMDVPDLSTAFNFTDTHPIGGAFPEEFILAEQMDLVRDYPTW
jgi:hypothetical protein